MTDPDYLLGPEFPILKWRETSEVVIFRPDHIPTSALRPTSIRPDGSIMGALPDVHIQITGPLTVKGLPSGYPEMTIRRPDSDARISEIRRALKGNTSEEDLSRYNLSPTTAYSPPPETARFLQSELTDQELVEIFIRVTSKFLRDNPNEKKSEQKSPEDILLSA